MPPEDCAVQEKRALIKGGKQVPDPWIKLADEDAIPPEGSLIISYERWQKDRTLFIARQGKLGIRLKSDQSPVLIAEDLDHFTLIALEFPTFRDGRAFSYARLLRERFGYWQEIRAVGDVLRDQFQFMLRCGFDAFEPAKQSDAAAWVEAASEMSLAYQPAADGNASISSLREPKPPLLNPADRGEEKSRSEGKDPSRCSG